jgi:hypothetical protein
MSSTVFQPTALYQFSGTQLQQLIDEIVSRIKVEPSATPAFAEMSTRQVRQHLTEKGYKAKTPATIKRIVALHGIQPIARGREFWYSSEEIFKIPPKKSI